MTVTQTIEIPANRRLNIEVPREIPIGRTILAFTPMLEPDAETRHGCGSSPASESITEQLNSYYKNHNSRLDDGLKAASYRLLAEVEW